MSLGLDAINLVYNILWAWWSGSGTRHPLDGPGHGRPNGDPAAPTPDPRAQLPLQGEPAVHT
eukprot:6330636-Pyramimonas_sp.AAC.2